MLPLLWPNDTVYFKKIAFSKIKVNDIIVIRKNKQFISHRVIYKTNKHLISKGDNNLQSDGRIYPGQIIGKIYQVKRNNQLLFPENVYLIQSTQYFSEIVDIKNIFELEKINYVFLKGLPLHLYYDKSHPKRIYADCDILINKEDLSKVEKILNINHYRKHSQSLSKVHTLLRGKDIEVPFSKEINGFIITFDIHLEIDWMSQQLGRLEELYPQKLINQLTHCFLQTKRKVIINNEPFWILTNKYLILYLTLHFFHHNFNGAFRLDFLDKVIRKNHLKRSEWADIADKINKFQLSNFTYPVFKLLQKYYRTPIPNVFINLIKYHSNKTARSFGDMQIFDDEPRIRAGISRFKNLFFLSPNPWWKKIFIFTSPAVVYSISWIILKKLSSSFSALRANPSDPS